MLFTRPKFMTYSLHFRFTQANQSHVHSYADREFVVSEKVIKVREKVLNYARMSSLRMYKFTSSCHGKSEGKAIFLLYLAEKGTHVLKVATVQTMHM